MSDSAQRDSTKINAEDNQVVDTVVTSGKKGRILVVDDEETFCQYLSDVLQRFGHEVYTMTSSVEALEAFRARPNDYDMVITDQTMPYVTGLALADHLRQIRPDISIILCTGYTELITVDEVSFLGINKILMKPVVMTQLKRIIESGLLV